MPSTIIPGFAYHDAHAAIDWLCRAFGFTRHAVYEGPDNTIAHAELTHGDGMIMLGSLANMQRFPLDSPRQTTGRETQHTNLIVEDADQVYATARAAGAEILIAIEDKPYGGRGFSCRDIEGHTWHIGTYNPWRK